MGLVVFFPSFKRLFIINLLFLITLNNICLGQYKIKYRPDEQFYEFGRGIDITKPYIGKRNFLKLKEENDRAPIESITKIEVVSSQKSLYSIFNISDDFGIDFNFFSIENSTFKSKSLYSSTNNLRIIIYCKSSYGKATLLNDDDTNLESGAAHLLKSKDYPTFIKRYGNYYVSGIEKTQVSAIALDFMDVSTNEIDYYKNKLNQTFNADFFSSEPSYKFESLIEKKNSEGNLLIQIYDFNKYNFKKDETARINLLNFDSPKKLLESISELLNDKLEKFSFENAAPSVYHLTPMNVFGIPDNLIPDILDIKLDDERSILYNLYENLTTLNEIKEKDNFKLFEDESLNIELIRLKNILSIINKSFKNKKNEKISESLIKKSTGKTELNSDDIVFPEYKDSLFYQNASLKNKEDYLLYLDYIGNVTDFFKKKYSTSPFSDLNIKKEYDDTHLLELGAFKSMIFDNSKSLDFEKLLILKSRDTVLVFANNNSFYSNKKDVLFNILFKIKFIYSGFLGGHPKFELDVLRNEPPFLLALRDDFFTVGGGSIGPKYETKKILTTKGEDIIIENPTDFQRVYLANINLNSDDYPLKDFFDLKGFLGFRINYLGQFRTDASGGEIKINIGTGEENIFFKIISISLIKK
jgi:hypothetical protein